MPRSRTVPSYRLHKPSGQAVVTVRTATGERRDVYLGDYNSPESRAEYGRLIAEHATAPLPVQHAVPERVTVDQLLLLFLEHAEKHYRRADGTPTDQVTEYKNALKPLHALYGGVPAVDFGPLALKTVRRAYIDAGNCRTLINSRVGKIKRVFKWATEQELVSVTTYTALATVAGLQEGRTEARESEPVGPVNDVVVDATLAHLNRHVAGMVQFQRLTGCRPGEAGSLRCCDIDASGVVWVYRPAHHKTKHKRKARVIAIGPKAQTLLKGFFTEDAADYLFSPRRAAEEFRAQRSAARKTPRWPSHVERNEAKRVGEARKRAPRARYGRQSYLTAIERACERVFPPPEPMAQREGESRAKWWARLTEEEKEAVRKWRREHRWHPHQLRHAVATEIRKLYGLDAAQVVLGHAHAAVTEVYAAKNFALAARIAAEMG
jgi:integrase